MFQSFSLAAFIPEIIMVLTYVFCLLGHTKTVETNNVDSIEPKIAEAHFQTSSSVCYFDQQFIQPVAVSSQEPIFYSLAASEIIPKHILFCLTDCLSFVQFSRPPPSFLI